MELYYIIRTIERKVSIDMGVSIILQHQNVGGDAIEIVLNRSYIYI